MAKFLLLIVFVVGTVGGGALVGMNFPADAWYESLNAPFFNPPGYIFGIVWPILYVLIAIAGWRVFTSEGETPGWGYWVAQIMCNFAWPAVFFGAQLIGWAIWLILATLAFTLTFIAVTWEHDRLAAMCFWPYAAWLTFASILNTAFWALN
ncbi:MAG: TspO/MBR family protein [Pseudomonadota bacterium]